MMIPIFKGENNEDPKSFFKNYKKTCISTGSGTTENWVIFLLKFLGGRTCKWYERQTGGYQIILGTFECRIDHGVC